jgi:hypothetical protein
MTELTILVTATAERFREVVRRIEHDGSAESRPSTRADG